MKKIAMLILVILMMLANLTNVFATEISSEDMAVVMSDLDIMNGYPDGSLHLNDKLTRAQFSKIIINASKYKNSVSAKSTISPFGDVQYSSWYAPYVSVAVANDIIKGYPDASFKPDNNVTLEEAVSVSLSVIGYTSDDFGSSWPYGQINLASSIGLLENVTAQVGSEMNRQDAMQLIYNMLSSDTKSGDSYVSTMGYKLKEDVVLLATNEEDSSIVSGMVYTTSGTYKILNELNANSIGKIGDVILNSKDELVSFIPQEQQIETYTAYGVVNNDIIVSTLTGYTKALGLDENTIIYFEGDETSLKNVAQNIDIGDIVNVSKSLSGDNKFVVISGNKMEGPLIAEDSNWYNLYDDNSEITVIRDGSVATLSDINTYDVLYYSKSLNMLWAYENKVTGIYEGAYPNKDQPTSITVSGAEYSLETVEAFNKISSKGDFDLGDTVTLLLGKDGKVADVISLNDSKTSVTGYLIDNGTKQLTNSNGYEYTINYIKVVSTFGNVLEYESNKDYSSYLNSVVKVKFSNGLASLSKVSSTNLGGIFDWESKELGSYSLAQNINIIDVADSDSDLESQYIITYPQRLDNVTISSSDVLYYSKNDNGEINELILKNVTGDVMKYGVVTDAEVTIANTSASSSYECDVNGTKMTLTKSNGFYSNLDAGKPASFEISNNKLISIKALSVVDTKITDINEIYIKISSGESYLLSSDIVVYERDYSGYKVIPLSDIIGNDNYSLKAYYDKSESRGGRIRVIVATEK